MKSVLGGSAGRVFIRRVVLPMERIASDFR